MILLNSLVKNIAKAIFNITQKERNLKFWKKMLLICIKVTENKNFKILFKSKCSHKTLSMLLINICKLQINNKFINLIEILAKYENLNSFSKILKELIILENKYKNNILINITISYAINYQQKKKIKNFFQKKKKKKYILKFTKDPTIVGGIIIKFKNLVYNFSISEFFKNSNFLY